MRFLRTRRVATYDGPSWQAQVVDTPRERATQLSGLIGRIVTATVETVRVDFGIARRVTTPQIQIVCATTETYVEMARVLCRPRAQVAEGWYDPGSTTVFLWSGGRPDRVLAHELAHALCHSFHNSRGKVVWAEEAYAEVIAARLAPHRAIVMTQARELLIDAHVKGGVFLRDFLTRSRAWRYRRTKEFDLQVKLFGLFLYRGRDTHPGGWATLLQGVAGRLTARQVARRLERDYGVEIEELEDQFVEFCGKCKIHG